MSLAEPQYSTLSVGHHVTPYSGNCHVTSPTNYGSPYDRLQVLGGDFRQRCAGSIGQTFPANYDFNEVLSNAWNDPTTPPSRQPADAFQPTKCLPTARQLPVSFDDVISGRQRGEYYGDAGAGVVYPAANQISWGSQNQLCQYGKNSVSGLSATSSFGARHVTCNAISPLTACPSSSSSAWVAAYPEPGYRACPEYRTSRYHVVSDVTSTQCGWTGVCDFDEMMWQGKFVAPLEGL